MVLDASTIIRDQIEEVTFGFYTDSDTRSRSVVEVNSSESYDALGNPLPRGLYDPRMGPMNQPGAGSSCVTCGNVYLNCPGHCGHIELCVPVYNILTFPKLLQLLKSKCLFCHNLRLTQYLVKIFQTKLHLLDEGFLTESQEFDVYVAKAIKEEGLSGKRKFDKTPTKLEDHDPTMVDMLSGLSESKSSSHLERLLDHYGSLRKNSLLKKHNPSTLLTSHERTVRREMILDFIKSAMAAKACESCGAHSPKFRHDSHNKIFHAKLAERNNLHNLSNKKRMRPALELLMMDNKSRGSRSNLVQEESGDDSEDEQDETEFPELIDDQGIIDNALGSKLEGTKFMHALEVEAQVKLTWRFAGPQLCCQLFGMPDANLESMDAYDTGYQVFFIRAVSVPPNRFRPAMVLGAMAVENAQNVNLVRILRKNQHIQNNLAVIRDTGTSDEDLNSNDEEKDESNSRSKPAKMSKTAAQRSLYINWIEIQTAVNCFIDSSKDPKGQYGDTPPGLKQIMEKKEGLFRRNMMGKRVDFACRSVISPDPYIGTNEIGLPVIFAKTLSFPTPVTVRNVEEMRKLVTRGAKDYPGANWVEHPNGNRFDLTRMSPARREALAATLISKESGIVLVGRQIRDGDMMLMNRQPTLHKPGIMAHRIRVLYNPNQRTIRMHYANCNTYNADYDGDEMNGHFPQNSIAHAEAQFIMNTDSQYISPTDGGALRGLIQDSVDGGVQMCDKDTFLERWQYQQCLMAALASLPGLEIIRSDSEITIMPPAIRKPRELWTGKQVITGLLQHLRLQNDREIWTGEVLSGISLERKAKTPDWAFGAEMQEHQVIIRDGELLRGVLDKAAFGASDYSVVHAVYEAYGPEKAGLLLNAFGRLFTFYIQSFSGHSCRMEDLILTADADKERHQLNQKAYNLGSRAAKAWADSQGGKIEIHKYELDPDANEPLKPHEVATTSAKLQDLLSGKEGTENAVSLDSYMQSQLNPIASQTIKKCLPSGLAVKFPKNTFSLMVNTGAKGSMVNQSQVSCSLGQQALEGRRVPRMASGRTLPSFAPYDPNPRADGFITDRFLTGIRPQEYFFHCMAGREGLVDTAVKTSRSGYLQRCLMKHLEEVKIAYDYTVRDSEGGVIQFLYGEDGIDPTKAPYLDCDASSFAFLARNMDSLKKKYSQLPNSEIDTAAKEAQLASQASSQLKISEGTFVRARKLKSGSTWQRGNLCHGWYDAIVLVCHSDGQHFDLRYLADNTIVKRVPMEVTFVGCGAKLTKACSSTCQLIYPSVPDPIISGYNPLRGRNILGQSGRCVSERVATKALDCILHDKNVKQILESQDATASDIGSLVAAKYSSAICAPGEAVGCIAAQGIGEPSTQMTLNTFHLAGSAANVTLGIPRLREIIMTASRSLKTPTMSVPINPSISERDALRMMRSFTKLTLKDLLSSRKGITVTESLERNETNGIWERTYQIVLRLHPAERIQEAFGLSIQETARVMTKAFLPKVALLMNMEVKKGNISDVAFSKVSGGEATEYVEEEGEETGTLASTRHDEDEYEDELANDEDGVSGSKFGHRQEMVSYGEMDEEDIEVSKPTDNEDLLQDDEDDMRPATVSEDEDELTFEKFSSSGPALKIDKKRNAFYFRPLRLDPASKPLLMIGLVEKAAGAVIVREQKNIQRAYVNDEDDGRGRCLQTAGVNFEEIWNLRDVDHTRLVSNDIWAIRCAYGVEAARTTIVHQVRGVFAVYGITVDPRHLSLIADYMTYNGDYRPMSRHGMKENSSAFLQMSFETTAAFLVEAALNGTVEPLASPSANIVMGKLVKHGTGAFDCLVKAT